MSCCRQTLIHWSAPLNSWLLTRYDHVVSALRNPRIFSSAGRMAALLDRMPEAGHDSFKVLYHT